ncbi:MULTISPECIES: ferredoxin [unclassified Streptosporangium]|uniref:ferredoxin n=1 Tax=unclassified Streptosporangium TaxID=2632669 RepID=UPI002DDB8630|nr:MULTISPECIES: ferredoxin [unclassified Streptosporangium]WSA29367.1 ferredoxin [Streptosporangium sp. NBC_01810]WSC99189.1 ferredoxin [Streptosporangium sp. NBC_01755]
MRVNVNAQRCIGAGQCVLIAPEVFDQSDEGTVIVLVEDLDDSAQAVMREAVVACPSRSISLAES